MVHRCDLSAATFGFHIPSQFITRSKIVLYLEAEREREKERDSRFDTLEHASTASPKLQNEAKTRIVEEKND